MPEQLQQNFADLERIRILETKYTSMRDRVLIVNQNMIDQYKKMHTDVSSLREEIKEIKKTAYDLKEIIEHIVSELKYYAKSEQVKVIEKYINFWNPLNFVTENEVKKIIKEEKDAPKKRRAGKQ
jgi:hypothetical protein